jgi:predicted ATP-dependent endonuclease of OLD family
MNEQLIVKNFGPITDATVDFKRVTVFIGPTGGGKSTLAKLAAIFRQRVFTSHDTLKRSELFKAYSIDNYFSSNTSFNWKDDDAELEFDSNLEFDKTHKSEKLVKRFMDAVQGKSKLYEVFLNKIKAYEEIKNNTDKGIINEEIQSTAVSIIEELFDQVALNTPQYIPGERAFVSAIEYSWSGLMRDNIGLPKTLLEFSNNFSVSRKYVPELSINFLRIKYIHSNGQDFIQIPESETLFRLYETASGIQSVTPLLVLLEHLSRNTEQAQSFIIEEPELNLYPTAQQGLLNWLVEKCTQGENDLTITTHSPYILSHLNLLLYAYQVAEKHPDRKEAVAAIVPEASWINPKEFACYQVENGGVQSLVDEELGLIDNNELDGLSGDAADAFDNLIRLSKGFAIK